MLTAGIAALLAITAGIVAKYVLDTLRLPSYDNESHLQITWREFGIVSVIMAVAIVPIVTLIGTKLSVENIVTYQQFLNGVETEAVEDVTQCESGYAGNSASAGWSNCDYTYVSGTYTYEDTYYVTVCTTDAKGNSTCTQELRCCVTETANIYTPYATREYRYGIDSSFGFKPGDPFRFSGTYIARNAKPYSNKAIPDDIPRTPSDWLSAKKHLDEGDPRPVTAVDSYPNYVLASKEETLSAYSADIKRFKKQGALPDHTKNIMADPIRGPSYSQANKASFVGLKVDDEGMWQRSLMRFNAALGMELQGDAHVVFVSDSLVTRDDAVPYLGALKSYWQGETFGKRALAKNAIIIAIGVSSDNTVTWAEATTGMPFGNELMSQYVRDYLPDTAFTPVSLFGTPRTVITGKDAKVTLSTPRGALERIVFESAPFARASMSCEDEDESCVGYKDLLDTIEPGTGQKAVMIIVSLLIALGLWWVVANNSLNWLFVSPESTRSLETRSLHRRTRRRNTF